MEQANFSSSRTFGSQGVPQLLQLGAIDLGCDSGIGQEQLEIDDTLKIPPNRMQNLFWMKVTFWSWLRLFVAIHPLALVRVVDVEHPLLIASDDLSEKGRDVALREQRVADGDT